MKTSKIIYFSLFIFVLIIIVIFSFWVFNSNEKIFSSEYYKHPIINCDKNLIPSQPQISINNKISLSKIVINNLMHKSSINTLESIFKNFDIEKGLFYFPPSSEFNPYPVDFGLFQDNPYGIVTIPKWGQRIKNNSIRHDYLGLLGAYNLHHDEAVIMYGEIDKEDLDIFYQSISSYLVDRENIILNSSTNPPLNNIKSKFAIIQTSNKILEKYLYSILTFYVDNIYSFVLGSKKRFTAFL